MDYRFKVIYEQAVYVRIQIILDTETGVRYLKSDNGITPLLDSSGSPMIIALPQISANSHKI